jgi:hypothetical protein
MLTCTAAPWRGAWCCLTAATLLATPRAVAAQTDYFNTDRGRPLHVQDAHAIERYALELQAAPVRWSRAAGPLVVWAAEPELAYGVLPRTQVEIGVPIFLTDGFESGARGGLGAVHLSVLHALNVETLGLPAFALEAGIAIPAGDFGPSDVYTTIGAIATRTVPFGRVHLNADVTQGNTIAADDVVWEQSHAAGLEELSRWTAGVAVDRALPLRSMLVGAELVARRPIREGADLDWHAATGLRWQASPQWAVDAGIGRTFGDSREWSLTFGAAWSFGLIHLIPLSR